MSNTSTDPIADMLTRIRNAVAVNIHKLDLPHSKAKESVAEILCSNNFISSVKSVDSKLGKRLQITINSASQNANISEVKRLSKPGRRQYVSSKSIPNVKRGRGIVIVSTSSGLMTGKEAQAKGIGGELICEVY